MVAMAFVVVFLKGTKLGTFQRSRSSLDVKSISKVLPVTVKAGEGLPVLSSHFF